MLSHIKSILTHWDFVAWYYINTQWHNKALDVILGWVREPLFWSPLYVFLAIFIPYRFGKKGWLWCLFFLLSFILSDQISAHVLKSYFHRLRPCYNERLQPMIHMVVTRGGMYGFPSTHATNHFCLGVFMAVTLHKTVRWIWPAAISWAALISYAQVYVGVHYPLDVTAGALLGASIGICTGKIFNRYFQLL